jgi:hypothetical protein
MDKKIIIDYCTEYTLQGITLHHNDIDDPRLPENDTVCFTGYYIIDQDTDIHALVTQNLEYYKDLIHKRIAQGLTSGDDDYEDYFPCLTDVLGQLVSLSPDPNDAILVQDFIRSQEFAQLCNMGMVDCLNSDPQTFLDYWKKRVLENTSKYSFLL